MTQFFSSLCYRPWGILVGVSRSFPAQADALLLDESGVYGYVEDIDVYIVSMSMADHVNGSCWWAMYGFDKY